MNMPQLKLSNVESAYGPVKAVRGVSLQVPPGAIVTVLGSNGAGKSTILKTISGIVEPLRGTIEFEAKDITGLDPARIVRCGISHVPEGRDVFPLLTVSENLQMGAFTRKDRDAVTELTMQALGPYALPSTSEPRIGNEGNHPSGAFLGDCATSNYLNCRKVSIYGGSNEIQRNIIAQMILGL